MKQVATFEKLLGFCNTHGARYQPSNAAITPAALGALLTSAHETLKAAIDARNEYVNAVHEQNKAIKYLNPYMTRIVNALAASGVTTATLEEANDILSKFRSVNRVREKEPASKGESQILPGKVKKRSYHDVLTRIENFEALVNLIRKDISYLPNEADLRLEALDLYGNNLRTVNTQVIQKLVNLSNAKKERNRALYSAAGIHAMASLVKHYIKSVFGFKSDAYAQISGLRFTTN